MSDERCKCQKAAEGMLGWDRAMISRDCPVHGHEALPEPERAGRFVGWARLLLIARRPAPQTEPGEDVPGLSVNDERKR